MNAATGFEGFQDQMLEAQEACGGDALASMAVEHLFTLALRQVMRADPGRRELRPYGFPGPRNSEWLRASDSDWNDAADLARKFWRAPQGWPSNDMGAIERMEAMSKSGLIGIIPSGPFHFVWSADRAWRLSRDHGRIDLAYRIGLSVSMTEPGLRLAESNGHMIRSQHRRYRTEAAATDFLGRACRDLWDGPQ